MQPKNFILTELRIHPLCNKLYTKVLKEKVFRFNQLDLNPGSNALPLERSIFGKRLFIQTIVGKNGSGKSSILELVYRIINNFSFFILKGMKPKRPSAEPVYLIESIYADLDFIIDDVPCSFLVRDRSFAILRGEERFWFGDGTAEFESFEDFNGKSKDEFVKLASSYFYTIATNYSFQSLISKDFDNDIVHDKVGPDGDSTDPDGNWLDNLFRKNDGYITPIVLNPFREEGKVDLQREYFLTLSRISALLIQAESGNKELLEGYRLATICYKANHSHFVKKLFRLYRSKTQELPLKVLVDALERRDSVANQIISAYGLKLQKFTAERDVIPYIYLVYKTLSVLSKYEQFSDLKDIPKVEEFLEKASSKTRAALRSGIAEIMAHRSHVNIKIIQTLNYIKSYKLLVEEIELKDYIPLAQKAKFKSIDEIIDHLPPPFYEQDIKLYRNHDKKQEISLSLLSSGERQFIYTVSTIVYHIKNLLSIQQSNRIRYRNINIVLDEVEICFHPEYQRQFIARLTELFTRLNLTRNCSFNILIVTHSPFMLSDIPKNNILYLKDGEQVPDEGLINPFAANINDILYQSFFLEGGFIGDHAKDTINKAVSAMVRISEKKAIAETSIWNEETIRQLIDMVGEPLLRDNLQGLFLQAFQQKSYEQILAEKDAEISRLKQMLDNPNNLT